MKPFRPGVFTRRQERFYFRFIPTSIPFSFHTFFKHAGIVCTGGLSVIILFRFQTIPASCERGLSLSKQKSISEIEQKAFVLLLINRRIFFGTPGRTGLTFNVTGGTTPSKFQGCLPPTYTVQSMHLTYGPMSGRLPS